MHCNKCDRNLTRCICDDCDERINSLKDSPYLAIDWDGIQAVRLLNRFDIERDREEAKKAQE